MNHADTAPVEAETLGRDLARLGRAERAVMPLAKEVIEAVAVGAGVCIRPVSMSVTDTVTDEVSIIDVPCGATLASKCPPCATRSRKVRMQQCREGWHTDTEPVPPRRAPTRPQQAVAVERAQVTLARDEAATAGDDGTAEACQEALDDLDALLEASGVRGSLDPDTTQRRSRSTKRRADAADLPSGRVDRRTIGRSFTGTGGRTFRPSMFLTLTLPSYGRVDSTTGVPVNPAHYDYQRAARDAIHFGKLLDRFVQNLRRMAGYDVQYFAALEPQRRLAPHAHLAIRGTIPRAVIRDTIAATYAQVWWPQADTVVYEGDRLPIWVDLTPDDAIIPVPAGQGPGCYIDPDTGATLPTWEEALDLLDQAHDRAGEDEDDGGEGSEPAPHHVMRFGAQYDAQGFLAGTPDADMRIGYLAKYLTKSAAECHTADDDAQRAHVDRLAAALRYQPCSPNCPNWLRYGVQPKHARAGMRPGCCKAKAHSRIHLGYGGRRVLVSRRWTGKTLADHRADRRAVVLAALGVDPAEHASGDKTADRYVWQPAHPDETPPLHRRLLHAVAERWRWRSRYAAAKQAAAMAGGPPDVSATPDHAD